MIFGDIQSPIKVISMYDDAWWYKKKRKKYTSNNQLKLRLPSIKESGYFWLLELKSMNNFDGCTKKLIWADSWSTVIWRINSKHKRICDIFTDHVRYLNKHKSNLHPCPLSVLLSPPLNPGFSAGRSFWDAGDLWLWTCGCVTNRWIKMFWTMKKHQECFKINDELWPDM